MISIQDDRIIVSIICDCYNHEEFITQALDGFVMQQCNFKFEVLIHDDASTDSTPKIIKEYQEKYPDIIKPILQKFNKFNDKKVNIWRDYQFPRVKGKYIAMCEGDDYWTDINKLQKQVDFLENNNDCNMVYHRIQMYDQEEGVYKSENLNKSLISYKRNIQELANNGNIMYTPSAMFKNNLVIPNELFELPVGDYVLWFLNAEKGKIGYLPDEMAVVRFSVNSTWGKKNAYFRTIRWLIVLNALKKYTNDKEIKLLLTKQAWNIRNYVYTSDLTLKEKFSINKILLKIEPKFFKRILLNKA